MVRNDAIKKTEYNKLVTKIDNIDTTSFLKKTKDEKDGTDVEDKIDKIDKKIPDVTNLVKKQILISKLLKQRAKYLMLLA